LLFYIRPAFHKFLMSVQLFLVHYSWGRERIKKIKFKVITFFRFLFIFFF
jgi:hypothetical protein